MVWRIKKKKHSNGSFFSDLKTSNFRQCKVFNRKHGVSSCEVFQRMNINNKWNTVKKEKLFVAWVMIITQKIAKEDENVKYKSMTRTITSCYIFRRKLTQQIEVDMEKMFLDENQIKQRNGSGNQTLSTVSNNASQVSLMTIAVILRNGETCGKCTTPWWKHQIICEFSSCFSTENSWHSLKNTSSGSQ